MRERVLSLYTWAAVFDFLPPSVFPDLCCASAVGGLVSGVCPLSAGLAALSTHSGKVAAAEPLEGLAEAVGEAVTQAHLSWVTHMWKRQRERERERERIKRC